MLSPMDTPARRCDRCGYAVGVRRVLLLVDGRAVRECRLCLRCLDPVLDSIPPLRIREETRA